MLYRPQWVEIPDDPKYRFEPWTQAIPAGSNFGGALAANQTTNYAVINFDRDADFLIMGIAIDAPGNFRPIGIQITDASGYFLMDDFVGIDLYALPLGQSPDRGGGYVRTFNPFHFVPAGGNWQYRLTNFDNVSYSIPDIEMRGYKRFRAVCE